MNGRGGDHPEVASESPTRNVLRDLYPYFVRESDPPRVAGAAQYRLYSQFGPDHLESRRPRDPPRRHGTA